jgi:soluble lytic murein transglycosylase-like protein
LPARGSSFPSSEALLLILSLPLLAVSCGAGPVWGMPVAEIRQRLAAADYAFLRDVDLEKHEPAEALAVGSEAPFYLAFAFDAVDRPEAALAMLELAVERSPEPWRSEAGVELAERRLSGHDYERAEAAARRAEAGAARGSALAARARRALVEALYWQKRDREVLQALPGLEPGAETDLFRAVSSWRLGIDDATGLFADLFLRWTASAVHSRAYTFLASDPAWLARFAPAERDLMEAKARLVQGEWSAGIAQMEAVLAAMDPQLIAGSTLVFDLGNAYVAGAMTARGGEFLERLSHRMAGQASLDCLETAGRLFRRAKNPSRAIAALGAVAEAASTTEQEDRARYYLLDVLLDLDPPDLAARIASESRHWNVPSTFADLFDARIAGLAAARQWRKLAAWFMALEEYGPTETRAQLAYLLARALQDRLLQSATTVGGRTPQQLLEEARTVSPTGYYGVAAACLLGELPEPIRSLPAGQRPSPADPAPARLADASSRALGPLAAGYLAYGLAETAWSLVWARRETLGTGVLLDVARGLARAGDYRNSLNLVAWLARRSGLAAADLALLYPRPYRADLERAATDNGVEPSLLWALVREESYFDADIVSSAGAVGLAQLMPDTAADVARQLKIDSPDLTDAATSLRMGARHLAGLLRRVDAPAKALLAYNAGLNRVRSWERAAAGLAPDLLVETVPFGESREYVRKIAVSAILYAWVYDGRDPRVTLQGLFPIGPRPGGRRSPMGAE